jgi:hypothetical protein
MTDTITIRRPDDWHVHLRDGDMLNLVAPYTARQFARAIIMPNLSPPVTRVEQAAAYRDRIAAAAGPGFTPLMTAYLTDDSDPDEIERGHREGVWVAAKLYPAGATTNSASGVTDIANVSRVLERMQKIGMPLARPRRSDRSRHRHLRPRSRVHRPHPVENAGKLPRAQDRPRTHHHPPIGRSRPIRRLPQSRGNHHPAASHAQPQRPVRRRPAPPRLLPAGGQARGASP